MITCQKAILVHFQIVQKGVVDKRKPTLIVLESKMKILFYEISEISSSLTLNDQIVLGQITVNVGSLIDYTI